MRLVAILIVIFALCACTSDETRLIGKYYLSREGQLGALSALQFSHKQASPVKMEIRPDYTYSITMSVMNNIPAYSGTMHGHWRLEGKVLRMAITDGQLVVMEGDSENPVVYTTNATDLFGTKSAEKLEFLASNVIRLSATDGVDDKDVQRHGSATGRTYYEEFTKE